MESVVSYFIRNRTSPNRKEKKVNKWVRMGAQLGLGAAVHPFVYSKVLIQLGYEPVAPQPSTSFAGKPVMLLPNIIKYTAHIRQQQGFFGCYRGVTPKMVGSLVSAIVSEKIAEFLPLPKKQEAEESKDLYEEFKVNLKREILISVSSTLVSQPFHVISLRMMAQFVGRETSYNNILGSIKEIYVNEGILGFFSGLAPRLLCDVAFVVLTSSTVYILHKFIKDKKVRQYNEAAVQFAISGVLYPMQVISTCMAVKGSNLFVAKPPIMPNYSNWIDCWRNLGARGELKRGSVMFWRKAIEIPEPQHDSKFELVL